MSSDEELVDEAALDDVVEQQSRPLMPENERLQVMMIEALEAEQLEEEEESEADSRIRMDRGMRSARSQQNELTFDTSLASRHIYLGDVDDTGHSRSFLEEGSVVRLPIMYLEGIVLFPESILPLRIVHENCKAAVLLAMRQQHARCTLAVLHVRTGSPEPSLIGTTAEIQQLRHLADGTINLVAKGRQRFIVRDAWTDEFEASCCEVRLLEDTKPARIPRDAFTLTAAAPSYESGKVPRETCELQDPNESDEEAPPAEPGNDQNTSIRSQIARFLSGQGNLTHLLLQLQPDPDSDEEDEAGGALPRWLRRRRIETPGGSQGSFSPEPAQASSEHREETNEEENVHKRLRIGGGAASRAWARDESKWMYRAQRAAWPHWVYRMYDAYDLARRAADLWRQMVELPSMDELVGNPVLLSFFIASKMPLPDETRQELLELDVVYRLRREIQLLECMDSIQCRVCKATIAKRRDVMVMSTDGPVNAFVNEHGYVHETLTLRKAHGLNLRGRPETAHSWFPGYAWTIANCVCDTHMGWRFTAVKPDMNPKAFWGIRRSQIASIS